MNIAILGIGHIAEKMAAAISGLDDNYKPYAAASRSIERGLLKNGDLKNHMVHIKICLMMKI